MSDTDDQFDRIRESEHDRLVRATRRDLAGALQNAHTALAAATRALAELRTGRGAWDVEYESQEGDDLEAHLEAAGRELRAANRICAAIDHAAAGGAR